MSKRGHIGMTVVVNHANGQRLGKFSAEDANLGMIFGQTLRAMGFRLEFRDHTPMSVTTNIVRLTGHKQGCFTTDSEQMANVLAPMLLSCQDASGFQPFADCVCVDQDGCTVRAVGSRIRFVQGHQDTAPASQPRMAARPAYPQVSSYVEAEVVEDTAHPQLPAGPVAPNGLARVEPEKPSAWGRAANFFRSRT